MCLRAALLYRFPAGVLGHQAVNDGARLAPIALSLFGTAGILKRERRIDYIVAGTGLGLACGTKYTRGLCSSRCLRPRCGMSVSRPRDDASLDFARRAVGNRSVLAHGPGIVFDTSAVLGEMRQLSPEGEPKLGQAEQSGSGTTSGRSPGDSGGYLPCGPRRRRRLGQGDRRIALVLVPAPVVFILFMGMQDRYFGRYLLPIFPIACLWLPTGSFGFLTAYRDLLLGWHPRSQPLLHWCCSRA